MFLHYHILILHEISQIMNNIGVNIRKVRERKGFSQEFVAQELGINQSTYGKIERENSKISIDRLIKIAEILQEDLTEFLDLSTKHTFNQTNKDNGYGYVETLITENKDSLNKISELYEKIIADKDKQIDFLKKLVEGR